MHANCWSAVTRARQGRRGWTQAPTPSPLGQPAPFGLGYTSRRSAASHGTPGRRKTYRASLLLLPRSRSCACVRERKPIQARKWSKSSSGLCFLPQQLLGSVRSVAGRRCEVWSTPHRERTQNKWRARTRAARKRGHRKKCNGSKIRFHPGRPSLLKTSPRCRRLHPASSCSGRRWPSSGRGSFGRAPRAPRASPRPPRSASSARWPQRPRPGRKCPRRAEGPAQANQINVIALISRWYARLPAHFLRPDAATVSIIRRSSSLAVGLAGSSRRSLSR